MRLRTSSALREHVEPGHPRGAGGRRHETRQDAHGRGFAGAVRPEKTDDFAAADRKGQSPHGGVTGVSLRQTMNFNDWTFAHW